VRYWVDERFLPIVAQHYRAGTFPMELVPEVARLRAFGPSIKSHGCAGLGSVAAGLIMQELERGDSGLRTFASVQGSLAMTAIDETTMSDWAVGLSTGCFWQTSIFECLEDIRNSGFGRIEICSFPAHLDFHDVERVKRAAALWAPHMRWSTPDRMRQPMSGAIQPAHDIWRRRPELISLSAARIRTRGASPK
jgi:hypothetical protein